MPLSRFITMHTWAMILIGSFLSGASELDLLGSTADHGQLIALGAGRSVVVEPVGELGVAADHVRGFHHHPSEGVVGSSVQARQLRNRHLEMAVNGVVHE